MLGVSLIPTGELAGRPALALPAGQLDYADPRCILHAVLQRRAAGVRAVTLIGAHWGSPELDRAIDYLASDPRTADLVVWAERSVTEDRWAAAQVWWVADASSLLAQPTTTAKLVAQIQLLPLIPVPSELVVRHPHALLAAGHLDELTTRLDCDQGWVHARPGSPEWDAAEVAVSQASGCWGLRVG